MQTKRYSCYLNDKEQGFAQARALLSNILAVYKQFVKTNYSCVDEYIVHSNLKSQLEKAIKDPTTPFMVEKGLEGALMILQAGPITAMHIEFGDKSTLLADTGLATLEKFKRIFCEDNETEEEVYNGEFPTIASYGISVEAAKTAHKILNNIFNEYEITTVKAFNELVIMAAYAPHITGMPREQAMVERPNAVDEDDMHLIPSPLNDVDYSYEELFYENGEFKNEPDLFKQWDIEHTHLIISLQKEIARGFGSIEPKVTSSLKHHYDYIFDAIDAQQKELDKCDEDILDDNRKRAFLESFLRLSHQENAKRGTNGR